MMFSRVDLPLPDGPKQHDDLACRDLQIDTAQRMNR